MSIKQVRGALVCVLLMIATACQTTTVPPPTPSATPQPSTPSTVASSSSPGPTPTPSATPPELSVRGFWSMVDELRAATAAPPEISKLNEYGRGQAFQTWSSVLMQGFGRGEHQVGKTSIVSASTTPGATATEYTVTVCLDSTNVDVVDQNGKSVKTPDAASRNTAVHTVTQDPKDGRWYVMTYEGRRGC